MNPECPDVDCGKEPVLPDACLSSHDKLQLAEEACSVLKGELFQPCHVVVDWGTYYYNCRYKEKFGKFVSARNLLHACLWFTRDYLADKVSSKSIRKQNEMKCW